MYGKRFFRSPPVTLFSTWIRNRQFHLAFTLTAIFSFLLFILQAVPVLANARWTYEIVWHAYCEEGTSTVCGEPTLNDYKNGVHQRMRTLNEIFRSAHVSFRLADIYVQENSTLAAIPKFCGDDSAPYEPIMEASAAADPTRIYWFGSQDSTNGCVNYVPSPSGTGLYAI